MGDQVSVTGMIGRQVADKCQLSEVRSLDE